MKDKILKLSLLLNILYALFILNNTVFQVGIGHRAKDTLKELGVKVEPGRTYESNPDYHISKSFHEIYPSRQAGIVMLGDSITEGVHWNELMGRTDIVNRGISGDVTAGLLNRLEHVYRLNPKACFIMGGVNDIGWVKTTETFENYQQIVRRLRERSIAPIIQSTLYTSGSGSSLKNKNIAELNRLLKQFAQEEGVEYVDINQALSKDGQLIEEYTVDGTHLTAKGYQAWAKVVEPIMQKYDL